MKWMTKMENMVMNMTGCDRQTANLVVNTVLEEDMKANRSEAENERRCRLLRYGHLRSGWPHRRVHRLDQ